MSSQCYVRVFLFRYTSVYVYWCYEVCVNGIAQRFAVMRDQKCWTGKRVCVVINNGQVHRLSCGVCLLSGPMMHRCRLQTVKLKAEARLDLLRKVGVSVDTWLKSAMNQVMEELENERWASLPMLTTHNPSLSVSTSASTLSPVYMFISILHLLIIDTHYIIQSLPTHTNWEGSNICFPHICTAHQTSLSILCLKQACSTYRSYVLMYRVFAPVYYNFLF